MRASSIRFINLLVSLLLLVGTIIAYAWLLRPAYREVNQLRGDLASKTELLKNQRLVVDEVKNLLAQYQTLTGPQQTVSLVLPDRENYGTLVNQISSLGRAAGLFLESVSVNLIPLQDVRGPKGKDVPIVNVIQLSLTLNGSYASFKSFLGVLETNIRLLDIVSFTVNTVNRPPDNYSYNLVVNAYYQSL